VFLSHSGFLLPSILATSEELGFDVCPKFGAIRRVKISRFNCLTARAKVNYVRLRDSHYRRK